MKSNFRLLWAILLLSISSVESFTPFWAVSTAAPTNGDQSVAANEAPEDEAPKLLAQKVAVVGATGRTGRYVVEELIDRGATQVVALVRSQQKVKEVFGDQSLPASVQFVECDLTNDKAIQKALKGMDAAIWCATGFSSESSWVDRLVSLVGIATKRSIDSVGLPLIAKALSQNGHDESLPKVVMCSSAGVTRPAWDEARKEQFPGAADIPIVRLNPFGILDIKRESEENLRRAGVPYSIVRPCGLNNDWPVGSRPILSQGDVAVGRIHRRDVATLLVDVLSEKEATGKTFEVIGLCNYPKARSMTPSLERLRRDDEGPVPQEIVSATYATMQQLLPGEEQNSAALAMGQTYEQLDKGETGRLGERGTEKPEEAGVMERTG